ncbi:MAG: hypothetical protein R3A47_06690 [Polyangiales bacterium]
MIANDGEDDGTALSIGPLQILDNITRWRDIEPPGLWTSPNFVFTDEPTFVAFDKKHERFLFFIHNKLWEYAPASGFVQLNPTGAGPSFGPIEVFYDSSEGAERLLLLSPESIAEPTKLTKVSSLDVSTRGAEAWNEITVTGATPSYRILANNFFDEENQRLISHGGLVGDLNVSSVSVNAFSLEFDGNSANWTNNGPSALGPNGVLGGVAVKHPTMPLVYFFGGMVREGSNWVPAAIRRVQLSSSGESVVSGMDLPAIPAALGAIAFYDERTDTVYGGLGTDVNFQQQANLWKFEVSNESYSQLQGFPSLLIPEISFASAFGGDASDNKGFYGVAGKIDGSWLLWPGYDSTPEFVSLLQLVGFDPTKTFDDAWSTVALLGEQVLAPTFGGLTTFVDGTYLNYWGALVNIGGALGMQVRDADDTTDRRWRAIQGGPIDDTALTMVGRDGDIMAMNISGPGGGLVSGVVYRFRNGAWNAESTSNAVPAGDARALFDPGCNDSELAVQLDASTIVLRRCDNSGCAWGAPISVPDGLRQPPLYDGVSKSILIVPEVGNPPNTFAMKTVDLCTSSPIVQDAVITGVQISAANSYFGMVRLPDATTPTWLVVGDDPAGSEQGMRVLVLQNTSANNYTLTEIDGIPGTVLGRYYPTGSWDSTNGRVVLASTVATVGISGLSELRWRELP